MKNFCVIEKNSRENHAGSKARNDVAEILENCGYTPVCVHHSEEKGTLDKLKMSVLTLSDWNHVSKVADSNNRIIIQYPLAMYPKVSQLAVPFVRKMKNYSSDTRSGKSQRSYFCFRKRVPGACRRSDCP